MQVIPYPHLDETLYMDQLSNGLKVYVLPKKGFQKTYATFSTKYGSIDNHFQIGDGPKVKVPDGIAHFLEHKMFEEPTGDIFAQFASQGASANAFTSFDRTAYLFSATEQIQNNIETLLNFVQNPYFTEENVEKEKGIINQEINMYKDNADWRSYFGLIEALFQVHPVHIDIAGTNESIMEISKDLLYQCYRTFYHPSNMSFFVVGHVDPEETMLLIRDNQAKKQFPPQDEIRRFFDEEPSQVRTREKVTILPVSLPKCLFGFKDPHTDLTGKALLARECQIKVLFDILFSSSSAIYQALYDENLISDTFGHEYNCNPGYGFSIIGGDTRDPHALIERIKQEVAKAQTKGLDPVSFERSRKKKMGGYLRLLNSPEAIANEFTKYNYKEMDLFDILSVYGDMTIEQVNAALQDHFNWDLCSVSIVRSEEQ
jgi:predicted Zn-dependent peptidase